MGSRNGTRVLVVDDDPDIRTFLSDALQPQGFEVARAGSGEEALASLQRRDFDVVVLDLKMPGLGGLETLKGIRGGSSRPEVVMLTGYPGIETAVEAIKLGAYDYISKPLDIAKLVHLINQAARKGRLEDENLKLRKIISRQQVLGPIVSDSVEMQQILSMIDDIAASDASVLITGETGTGKGLIAKLIHSKSGRSDLPLVPVNCGALNEQLFESELFGHEKGSFTGAIGTKPGLFEVADRGTIFLDEVAEMTPSSQAKLLQVLDTGELRRVGGTGLRQVDVRVLAATNTALAAAAQEGGFRQDLFFRLNTVEVNLPPLRERRDDIRGLVEHYLRRFRRPGEPFKEISDTALQILLTYDWPGNVRELANTLETLTLLTREPVLLPDHLPANIRPAYLPPPEEESEPLPMSELERLHITRTLRYTEGNKAAAARLLGIHVKTLSNKIRAYEIEA